MDRSTAVNRLTKFTDLLKKIQKEDEFRKLELRWDRFHRIQIATDDLNLISFSDFYAANKME